VLSRIEPKWRATCLLLLQAAAIALATWFVYGSVIRAGWLWDDGLEITNNFALRDRAGLAKIWFSPAGLDYFPLKTTLQWAQWHLWQARPAGYHATNVALHLLSAYLLWRVLVQLGIRLAWLGGLIFAIHPLAVESVAWISELKNVLSLPLLLLAMIFWIRWSELPPTRSFDSDGKKTRTTFPMKRIGGNPLHLQSSPNEARSGQHVPPFYFLSLFCFVASMLSKSSVVMFPLVLLLYAWWKRGRVARSDWIATIPFFAVSLVLGLVTVWFQVHRAIADPGGVSDGLFVRLAVAGLAAAFYFFKSVWPVGLLPIYPRWEVSPVSLWEFWPWVAVAIATILIWRWSELPLTRSFGSDGEKTRTTFPMKRIRGNPLHLQSPNANQARSGQHAPPAIVRHLVFGLGFFLINLLPVLGLFPMAYQRISWVADHFAYLPLVGLVGVAAAAISNFEFRIPKFGSIVIAALLAALAISSRHYARIFQNEKTLWTYTLSRNPQAWIGYNNLGIVVQAEGRKEEAIGLYEQALRLRPDFAEAHNDLGIALAEKGRLQESLEQYERAIRSEPNFADAYNNEGNLLLRIGRIREAIEYFARALRINPDFAEAHNGMGNGMAQAGRPNDAIPQYEAALRLRPDFPEARSNLGAALARAGRLDAAIAQYEAVLRLHPDFAEAHNNLGVALAQAGRVPDAIAQYKLALHYQPGLAQARVNLDRLEHKP